jgi:uncharacterized protein YidB (DUF937 family)
MSPITMAILALLAYKGIKHFGGSQQPAPSAPQRLPGGNPQPAPGAPQRLPGGAATQQAGLDDILSGLFGGKPGAAVAPGGGGDLGGLLKGGLGGLLAGGAAGSILSGGLGSLLEQFQKSGQGQAASSWVGKGPNDDISEGDLAKSIGLDDIEALAKHTGMSRSDLLAGLSRELPEAIDEMTPNGRLPTAQEASRWV